MSRPSPCSHSRLPSIICLSLIASAGRRWKHRRLSLANPERKPTEKGFDKMKHTLGPCEDHLRRSCFYFKRCEPTPLIYKEQVKSEKGWNDQSSRFVSLCGWLVNKSYQVPSATQTRFITIEARSSGVRGHAASNASRTLSLAPLPSMWLAFAACQHSSRV